MVVVVDLLRVSLGLVSYNFMHAHWYEVGARAAVLIPAKQFRSERVPRVILCEIFPAV